MLLAALTTACGDLPEPFLGNPGATARRLAQPMTPLLAVPPPADALLPEPESRGLADNLATALQMQEVPAMARVAQKTDWQLVTRAEVRGQDVVPMFTVRDPKGEEQGSVEGAAIPQADWAMANDSTLRAAAVEAAPKIAATLTGIRIARDRADPNSLYNRPAKVLVADVTGAPGDGNQVLTQQMRTRLAALGPVVLTTPAGADFAVRGQVTAVPIPGRQQRIEIQWYVSGADGGERGRVVQLNEIPAGTLDRYWGDVAVVVATEASGGVYDVIKRQVGREPESGASGEATTRSAAAAPH